MRAERLQANPQIGQTVRHTALATPSPSSSLWTDELSFPVVHHYWITTLQK